MKRFTLFQKQAETPKTRFQSEGSEPLTENQELLWQELSPLEMSKISGGIFGGPPMRPDLPVGYGRIPL